jgi:hypothetical protein
VNDPVDDTEITWGDVTPGDLLIINEDPSQRYDHVVSRWDSSRDKIPKYFELVLAIRKENSSSGNGLFFDIFRSGTGMSAAGYNSDGIYLPKDGREIRFVSSAQLSLSQYNTAILRKKSI